MTNGHYCDGVTADVIVGVIVGVNGVSGSVWDGVDAGVTEGVWELVNGGVRAGVWDGVSGSVWDGVDAGVTEGVTEGVEEAAT